MFYTIYKITNQVDGKTYIGAHKTRNLDDRYMGSGKYLMHAQAKYGLDKFTKEILFVFDNPDDMYAKEAELVNEDFLATENTYNLKVGGLGGWDYFNSVKTDEYLKSHLQLMRDARNSVFNENPLAKQSWRTKLGEVTKNRYANGWKSPFMDGSGSEAGAKGREKARHSKTRKDTMAARNHQQGSSNSQFGTMWITDGTTSVKIAKDATIPEGWRKGRTLKK